MGHITGRDFGQEEKSMRAKCFIPGIFVLCLSMIIPSGLSYAAGYPDKPINLIINFGGGGTTDTSARILSKAAEKYLKVPVSPQNKPGGLGTTGVIELKNKAADGYNIGAVTYAPLAIIPHQMDVPYTPSDFDYILSYAQFRYGLFVKADSPLKNLDDLVAAAKKAGSLTYVASGVHQTFGMQDISRLKGVTFDFMPVKAGADVNAQILGGHVDVACAIIGDVVSLCKSGELRGIALFTDERLPALPDVLTAKEQGYPITLYSYMAIAAPKGMPADRLAFLRKAYAEAYNEKEFHEVMERLNIPAVYTGGEEFGKLVEIGYKDARRDLEAMGMLKK